jgi:hypothetical protein
MILCPKDSKNLDEKITHNTKSPPHRDRNYRSTANQHDLRRRFRMKTSTKQLTRFLCFLLVFTLLTTIAGTVQAATESLNVQAGEDSVRKIDVSAGDHIQIDFTVLSQSPSSMRFRIVFPNGTTKDYGESSSYNISFISDVQGECALHFDNTNSSRSQLVTLEYEIEHYYFGIPEIPFLIIVIAVLLLCIAAGYIIMGKYS